MKQIQFSYTTKQTFDDDVHDHSFALRVIPPESPVQKILHFQLTITPSVEYCRTVDAFGNNVVSGYISFSHRFLDFSVKGAAVIDLTQQRTDFLPCYRYPSELTRPDEALTAFYNANSKRCENRSIPERAAFWSELLSDTIVYQKGVTSPSTTAAEVFADKAGVCQDFAHVMIALLRLDHIPARYIAGLAYCDGETHAWVEYWNNDHWEAIDPSNNCMVTEQYLILSQGRDFGDCAVDRGIMLGDHTRQMQLVRSALS